MELSDIESDANNVKFWFSKRFYVAVLMFFGTINTFSLSANLNIAIVEMTSQKNVTINNETVTYVSGSSRSSNLESSFKS